MVEAGECHDRLHAVLAQRPLEFVLGVSRIQWRDNGTQLPGAELSNGKLRAVGQEQGDAIATPDAERVKGGRAGVALLLEGAPGHRRALEQQGGVVWTIAGEIGEIVEKRAVGIRRQRRRDAGVVMRHGATWCWSGAP